jgi:anti-anti-sigma factor
VKAGYRELTSDLHLVQLRGPLNVRRAADVIQLFRDLYDQGIERVLVNLAQVPFIDGQGLAALIAVYRLFGGDSQSFRLTGIQDQPRLVFELTGFDRIFGTVAGSGDAAVELLAARLDYQVVTPSSPRMFVPQTAQPDLAV